MYSQIAGIGHPCNAEYSLITADNGAEYCEIGSRAHSVSTNDSVRQDATHTTTDSHKMDLTAVYSQVDKIPGDEVLVMKLGALGIKLHMLKAHASLFLLV